MPLGVGGGAEVGGGIGGAIGAGIGLAFAGRGGRRELRRALQVWEQLKTSDFDFSNIPAPDLRMFAEAFPELAQAVLPPEAVLPEESQVGRGAQLRGLGRFERIAEEGLPLAERLAVEDAQRRIGREARSVDETILADLAARGRLGAGTEIAARAGTSQRASQLAATQGRDLAEMIAMNRLGGAQAAFQAGGEVRRGDVALSQSRADAMNRLNELRSRLATESAFENRAARERAQAFNVGTRQRIGEQSALTRRAARETDVNRQNALRQAVFGQQATRAQGMADVLAQLSDYQEQRRRQRVAGGQQIGQGVGSTVGGLFG